MNPREGAVAPEQAPTRKERAAAAGNRAAMSVVRLIALAGIVGLAIIAGAILTSQDVRGWIIGLAVGAGAVMLSSIVFLSRRLSQPASIR